ncbi:MAG: cupin domain-containing protein [Anaerolineae bacterium]
MIIHGSTIPELNGRMNYGVEPTDLRLRHFVVRRTTSDNPFPPHEHDGREYWFILEGSGVVTLGGEETAVSAGDLVVLDPWLLHGLRSDTEVRWICFG